MRQVALLAVLLGLAAAVGGSPKTDPYVYRLVITGCEGASGRYVQSAFKVAGFDALFTALHGVSGCSSIEAFDYRGAPAFEGRKLKLRQADVARDAAELILVSEPGLPIGDGLVGATSAPQALQRLLVYGFPSGRVISRGTEVHVADPALIRLSAWPGVPPNVRVALGDRKSPDPEKVDFVDIDGTMLPGHSGAPLLNDAGQVVAVADGGLNGGQDNRAWAIAWSTIKWRDFDNAAGNQLGHPPAVLFAYAPEADQLPSVAREVVAAGVRGVISVRPTGYVPGLLGELDPILDSSGRTYLYATNVAIEGGQPQPVPFELNHALHLEDSAGNRFSISVTSITSDGATISYEKLPVDQVNVVHPFQVGVLDQTGAAISGAAVQVVFADGTFVSTSTDAQGRAAFENVKRAVGDLSVTHPDFVALSVPAMSLRAPFETKLRRGRGGGSLTFAENTGVVPGLHGRLQFVLDTLGRTYLYADNIAIAGGQLQPVTFSLNAPFDVEDSTGNRFAVTVTAIGIHSSTILYEPLGSAADSGVQDFGISVVDEHRMPVSGADAVVAFKDGTVQAATTDATGVAQFQRVKQTPVDIFVAAANYAAGHIVNADARKAVSVVLHQDTLASSGVFIGTTGFIPGLDGRLNPQVHGSNAGSTEHYLYATDIQINEGSPQPVQFKLGESLRLRDRHGVVMLVSVLAMTGHASLFEYRKLSP